MSRRKDAPRYDQLPRSSAPVLEMLTEAKHLYEAPDEKRAPAFIELSEVLKDECDDAVEQTLRSNALESVVLSDLVGTALVFRYSSAWSPTPGTS